MENSDRELLEFAAKAAGFYSYSYENSLAENKWGSGKRWNPITDDGDALRLAVNLHLLYGINTDILNHYLALELPSDEPLAAIRRAIVRAAAEIGRNMK